MRASCTGRRSLRLRILRLSRLASINAAIRQRETTTTPHTFCAVTAGLRWDPKPPSLQPGIGSGCSMVALP
eukprot:CAMPEP_0181225930 /NCGR_PEP_ID=MMETSP1096-20121128/31973_1 /TAXON_ID=156174 ORGANISM="Chrysochromulina ericina, Strain CCMP281" /NCGR_SAMPLE_ID=MMETSP1096 /ASSEMBLY_ACC=CAM_ASM_000453 /LENGTH=70 /DNA_ID=CAMNT_0023319213 /DNA_START=656 /DNA_END=871 /DNA_ORIENTATION=-